MRNWKRDTLYMVTLLLALSACSETAPPEQRVQRFIGQMEARAEQREFKDLVDQLAPDYLDDRGNDKLKAAAILRGFYLRYKSVHLLTRIDSIDVRSPEHASAVVYVAMAQHPFPAEDVLPDADIFRVELDLVADGDSFEILRSAWTRASAVDLLH